VCHGGRKNQNFDLLFCHGALATCLEWVQKARFWGISAVSFCECINDDRKWDIFWDKKWLLWYPKYDYLGNFFFSEGNYFFLFYNLNTATHGNRKNQNFDFFFFFFERKRRRKL
jgi:hypothetical protein